MTLTIDIPNELAARVIAVGIPFADVSRYAVAGIAAAVEVTSSGVQRNRSIMEFEGVGEGRPGAIGENVQEYIDAMRGEWDEPQAASHEIGHE